MTNRRASYLARVGLRPASGFASPRQNLTELYGLGPVMTSRAAVSYVPARNLRKAGPDTRTRVRSFGRCDFRFPDGDEPRLNGNQKRRGGGTHARTENNRARAQGQAGRQGPDHAGRRVRSRRDSARPRGKTWCTLGQASHRYRPLEGTSSGRRAPVAARHEGANESERGCSPRRPSPPSIGSALSRGSSRAAT
jgi:hypothetical protein